MSKELRSRKSNRRIQQDYAQAGVYFVTICVKDHACLLWEHIVDLANIKPDSIPALSQTGMLIDKEIQRIQTIYPLVSVDQYVVMPNHIHLIIELHENTISSERLQVAPNLSRIVQQFKGSITKKIGYSIWQKSFHDHIVQSADEYQKIRDYIRRNPDCWIQDRFFFPT